MVSFRTKEKREVKRRKKNKEEETLEASFPILEGGDVVTIKQLLMRWMEYMLSSVKSSTKYGPRSKENADFSACIGFTSNTIGLNGFQTLHNLRERRHLGIHLFNPLGRRAPWWLLEMWHLSTKLIPLYGDVFSGGKLCYFG